MWSVTERGSSSGKMIVATAVLLLSEAGLAWRSIGPALLPFQFVGLVAVAFGLILVALRLVGDGTIAVIEREGIDFDGSGVVGDGLVVGFPGLVNNGAVIVCAGKTGIQLDRLGVVGERLVVGLLVVGLIVPVCEAAFKVR